MSQDLPSTQNYFNFCRFELNVETLIEQPNQRIMTLIRRTADRVLCNDDPVAIIDRGKNGGQQAHIGLRTGNNERVDLALSKMVMELWVAESGIDSLVKYDRRRRISSERRQEVDKPVVDPAAGYMRPLFIIGAPTPGASSGFSGGIKRVKIVRSGARATSCSTLGVTRGIQAMGQGPSSENRRCMSMQR
jgi:hypothetical protein